MKFVTKYEASGGTLFDTIEEAEAHEELFSMEEWYEKNKLYGNSDGCRIEFDSFLEWLRYNKAEIIKIIKAIK